MTIWTVAFAGLIWLSCSAVLLYGGAVTGRHRAETAADLAALAAAVHVPDGQAAACAHAFAVAAVNGGSLRECRVVGDEVEVEVARTVRLGGLGVRTALARARAGPVDALP
ncbi:MAG TPA: Rv3654c family TadE-like protein [Mycobacteriales bacterium]|nr:Rv3654c family TadE-like protein [Mycobacteriales bacterium]